MAASGWCPGRSLRILYRFSVTLRLPAHRRVERASPGAAAFEASRGICFGSSLFFRYERSIVADLQPSEPAV